MRKPSDFYSTTPRKETWLPLQRPVRSEVRFAERGRYGITYSFFVSNTNLSPEEVVDFYQKRGNCEIYIKEAKYDMAVDHLLLKSFIGQ
jgi:hypothetical protein